MRHSRRLLAIVCRNPEAGAVKTRLIPALGVEGARALYRAFLRDLGSRFSRQAYDLVWAYTPEGGPPPVALTPGMSICQDGPELGHRLYRLFDWAREQGYEATVVISSDVPHLPARLVDEAFAALDAEDLVLAPSHDGGYHLVGQRLARDVFTMVAMSTPAVLAQTLDAAAAQALRAHLLEADFDVDVPDDLPRLAARLAGDVETRDGETLRVLRGSGWAEPPAAAGWHP